MPACDIAVMGAGVFASWTAWHLRRLLPPVSRTGYDRLKSLLAESGP
jgi:glycine/D-amino acid oxidase-like deaminating enzyme